jgi:hypothetical protein
MLYCFSIVVWVFETLRVCAKLISRASGPQIVAIPYLSKLKSVVELFTRVFQVKKETYLSSQLRESATYLKDAGFRQTATLLLAAADEIETLQQCLATNAEAPPKQQSSERELASEITQFPRPLPTAMQA